MVKKGGNVAGYATRFLTDLFKGKCLAQFFMFATFKTDISDHFSVCIITSLTEQLLENKYTYVYKRVITNDGTERFNQALY